MVWRYAFIKLLSLLQAEEWNDLTVELVAKQPDLWLDYKKSLAYEKGEKYILAVHAQGRPLLVGELREILRCRQVDGEKEWEREVEDMLSAPGVQRLPDTSE